MRYSAAIAACCLMANAPYGQAQNVSWNVSAESFASRARMVFAGTLPAEIPGDGPWRMYALGSPPPSRAVEVEFVELPAGLALPDSLQQLGARSAYDRFFDTTVVYFEQRGLIWADFDAPPGLAGDSVRGRIGYMICNDRICLPPTEAAFAEVFRPAAAAWPDRPEFTGPPATPLRGAQQAEPVATPGDRGDLWAFLLLAIGAGFGAFLMPCIYPMIPITVSYFAHNVRASAIRMALVYGLAIVGTFTGLGTLLSLLVSGAGAQSVAANPWVNLFIALAFTAFAFSLLGFFELRLPSGLVNWFGRQGQETGTYVGVLFMGLTLTLVSFSCTVPFVGLLLPSIAAGEWFYGIVGMATFSTTFALPFVAFACFPKALNMLPGSGGWMRVAAVVFGFVELAAALKFLSNADLVWGLGLISRPLAIALWIVIAALAGFYLIGHLRLEADPAAARVSAGRLVLAVCFFGAALYMVPGLFGGRLGRLDAYLPPRSEEAVAWEMGASGVRHHWFTDDVAAAYAEAIALDRPVMIDFTGYTCTNCREMEVNVFERGEVSRSLASDFVLLRLYTDGPKDREFQRFQLNLAGTLALPTYAIMDPFRPDVPLIQLSGVVSSERFAEFLDEGRERFRRPA
ncbi:MAG: thioredoxin family protein [Bacteroidota bacterium]|nr:thioredoxin family protein [Bacteroidota bacterium]